MTQKRDRGLKLRIICKLCALYIKRKKNFQNGEWISMEGCMLNLYLFCGFYAPPEMANCSGGSTIKS